MASTSLRIDYIASSNNKSKTPPTETKIYNKLTTSFPANSKLIHILWLPTEALVSIPKEWIKWIIMWTAESRESWKEDGLTKFMITCSSKWATSNSKVNTQEGRSLYRFKTETEKTNIMDRAQESLAFNKGIRTRSTPISTAKSSCLQTRAQVRWSALLDKAQASQDLRT